LIKIFFIKADEIDPSRSEVYSLMIDHATINQDVEALKEFNTKWMETGEISQGILAWNYNSLMSLSPHAILITHGDNDTYPAWMLQQVQDLRGDVEVINLNLLKNKEYCDAIFKKCRIPVYPTTSDQKEIWTEDFIPVADHLMKHSVRPIYFSITTPKSIRNHYKDDLYTVGLSFKYSKYPFDNITELKNNYENQFLTDYMKVGFQNDKSITVLNTLNMSYLPAFFTLYKEYLRIGDDAKADNMLTLIKKIAESGGQLESIVAFIETSVKPEPISGTLMNIKSIDKLLKKVDEGLYAGDTEVINEFYEQFLMDLLRNKEFELLDICKTSKTDWMSLVPAKFKELPANEIFRQGDPDCPGCPVQNISYEAAVIYCDWLTRAYNGYEKKKNFQEVRFRLPTEEEWIKAAQAGRAQTAYPWGGYYYQNAKGCYLSNFYSSDRPTCIDCNDDSPDNDGAFFLVKADAYFPNDLGLYGMSGNVAEMVHEKGISKGGSWEDIPEECTIQSVKKVEGPSPAIGFRVFMEVIR